MKNLKFSYKEPSEKKAVLTKAETLTLRGGDHGDDDVPSLPSPD